MPRSWSHLVNLGLLAWLVAEGVTDGWSPFIVGGAVAAGLLYASAWALRPLTLWAARHYPQLVNIPKRSQYEALPWPGKKHVLSGIIGVVQRWLTWETAGILAVMAVAAAASPSAQTAYLQVGFIGLAISSMVAGPFLIWRVQATVDATYDRT